MEQISEETIKEFIQFLKSHPSYRDQLAELFDPGEFVRRDELVRILEEIKQQRTDTSNHFTKLQEQIDQRFDKVFERFDQISLALGHDFEEFNSLWLQDYLRVQGYPKLKIKKVTFYDENYEVFPDSNDVEVDVYNEDPFIIGEITAITKTIDKITLFLRKVDFLRKRNGSEPQIFFITYGFVPKIRAKALELLEKSKVKVFAVRQKDLSG